MHKAAVSPSRGIVNHCQQLRTVIGVQQLKHPVNGQRDFALFVTQLLKTGRSRAEAFAVTAYFKKDILLARKANSILARVFSSSRLTISRMRSDCIRRSRKKNDKYSDDCLPAKQHKSPHPRWMQTLIQTPGDRNKHLTSG